MFPFKRLALEEGGLSHCCFLSAHVRALTHFTGALQSCTLSQEQGTQAYPPQTLTGSQA